MDLSYYKKFEPIDGKWYISRELGTGSFGTVFEVERRDLLNVKAAMKIISIPSSQSEYDNFRSENYDLDESSIASYFYGFVEEFTKEFQLMALLRGNANIVNIEDYEVKQKVEGFGWDIFIRMELLTSMNDYFKLNPPTERSVIKLGIDLCKALEACKNHGIIHRDIKPSNIFISQNGDFKLGDFGVARTLEKGAGALSRKGTFTYTAPEVFKEQGYGAGVDIYSLGIVMYKLCNNNLEPFRNDRSYTDSERALSMRLKGEQIPRPIAAGDALSSIILKACAYNPANRYTNPSEMRADLENVLFTLDNTGSNTATVQNTESITNEAMSDNVQVRQESFVPYSPVQEATTKEDSFNDWLSNGTAENQSTSKTFDDTTNSQSSSNNNAAAEQVQSRNTPQYNDNFQDWLLSDGNNSTQADNAATSIFPAASTASQNSFGGFANTYATQRPVSYNSPPPPPKKPKKKKTGLIIGLSIAAILIILTIIGIITFINLGTSKSPISDSTLEVVIDGFSVGKAPKDLTFKTSSPDKYYVSNYTCKAYNNSSSTYRKTDSYTKFEDGKRYCFDIVLSPKSDYEFTKVNECLVNGEDCGFKAEDGNIIVSYYIQAESKPLNCSVCGSSGHSNHTISVSMENFTVGGVCSDIRFTSDEQDLYFVTHTDDKITDQKFLPNTHYEIKIYLSPRVGFDFQDTEKCLINGKEFDWKRNGDTGMYITWLGSLEAVACEKCGSFEHAEHPTCAYCGSSEHIVHPTCSYCGSYSHTAHPTCSYCGSYSHTVHPTCSYCGSYDHTVHKSCTYCGSMDHTTHPSCPDCGSYEHTVHPKACPYCGSFEHTSHPKCSFCGSYDHTHHEMMP